MLEKTRLKLSNMYDGKPQPGSDGKLHPIDRVTKTSFAQGEKLIEVYRGVKPETSLEVGLAYGYSAIFLLDEIYANLDKKKSIHIAIDPFEQEQWSGIGLAVIEELGFSPCFEWINDRSDSAFIDLRKQNRRVQFVYLDGNHKFDGTLVDLCLVDHILDVGGVVLLDDMWMPSKKTVAAYVETNMQHFKRFDCGLPNLGCFRKIREDDRSWNHFARFPVSRAGEGGIFKRLLGGS